MGMAPLEVLIKKPACFYNFANVELPMGGHVEILKLLMSVTDNPNAPNNAGITPYTIALQNNHHDIAALFPVVGDFKWWCFIGVSLLQPLLIAFLAEMKI